MNNIETLLNLLSLHGGEIVCTSSLDEDDIKQAKTSGRMYVDDNGIGFVWEPKIMRMPETDEELAFFEKWYPIQVELPDKFKSPDFIKKLLTPSPERGKELTDNCPTCGALCEIGGSGTDKGSTNYFIPKSTGVLGKEGKTAEEILTEFGVNEIPNDEMVTVYYPALISAIEYAQFTSKPVDGELTIDDYKEVIEDHKRLCRELDEIINGKDGMAKQASLCDLVGQIASEYRVKPVEPKTSVTEEEIEKMAFERMPKYSSDSYSPDQDDNYYERLILIEGIKLGLSMQQGRGEAIEFAEWIRDRMLNDSWFRPVSFIKGKWYVDLKGHLTTQELYDLFTQSRGTE